MRDCTRDTREKVDNMQHRLDEIMKATEVDKQAFRKRESELIYEVNAKESELNKLR